MTSPPAIPKGLQVFLDHAKSLQPSNNSRHENGFAREFQQIKEFSSQLKKDKAYCTLHGELDYNRSKNRYKDIVPFDDTRIKLPTVSGVKGSDYINGNYIKGPDGSTSYLAVQGPLPRTVNDFWRLIASHKIQVVIMVCKEIEMGKLKCKRYWPENTDEKLNFAGLEISLISEQDVGEGLIIRTMQMKSVKEQLQVTQVHYTAWPDHDVPESAASLIELNKTARAVIGNRQQQVLVHCSAGCGRTGTICAVNYALGLLKMQKTDNFSVFDIVKNLRRQRMAMVQTKEQYELVYKAVVQLVEEELEQTRLQSHTYVNVKVPAQQSSERGDYENSEFAECVNRWKNEGDINNGAVHKPVPPVPTLKPQTTENKIMSPPPVKPASDQSYENCAIGPPPGGKKSTVPMAGNKVNWPPVPAVRPTSLVKESDGVKPSGFKKPPPAVRNRNSDPDLRMEKGTVPPLIATKKSPTAAADYEVLPKSLVPGTRQSHPGPGDYEIPPLLKNIDKKHVPEGLLIDLESEGPPLPVKRHSGCKDEQRCTGIEDPRLPGTDGKRSSSSPVLGPTMLSGSGKAQQSTSNTLLDMQSHKISDGFHTVPSRMCPVSVPARPRLTGSTFEDPSPSNTGLKLIHLPEDKDPKGQYFLVGAASDTPPKSVDQNKARPFTLQLHRGTGPEKGKPTAEGHVSPQFKETVDSKPKICSPVGAYALVGIPDIGTIGTTSSTSVQINKPFQNPEHVPRNAATDEPLCNLDGQRQPVQHKSAPSVHPYSGNMVSAPHTAATAGVAEQGSLYAVVEDSAPRKEPQEKSPHAPPKLQNNSGQFSKSASSLDVSLRGQADGEAVVVQDLYATVAPRVKDKRDCKERNGLSTDSGPNLRPQTSSGSLQSFTSVSSDELDEEVPPVPEKTDEAFLAPGEDAYDKVEQTNRGTLDRFKKMMKTPSKGSFLKRHPDQSMLSSTSSSLPAQGATPPRNSPVIPVNCTLEGLGYLKRVAKPVGPRACPKNWPSLVHLGL